MSVGCLVSYTAPARALLCVCARLCGAVRADQQGGVDRRVQLVQRSLSAEITHRHVLRARRIMGG